MSEQQPSRPAEPTEPTAADRPRRSRGGLRRGALRLSAGTAYLLAWLACATVAAVGLFLGSSRTTTLASHDVVLRPELSDYVVVHTGPVLPDVRLDSGVPFGVDIQLGKTDVPSTEALVDRYAFLASQPEGVEAKVRDALVDMAVDAALRGAALGLLPILIWTLVGSERRRQLLRRLPTPEGVLALLLVALVLVGLWRPWGSDDDTVDAGRDWMPLQEFLGAGIPVPEEARGLEVRGDATTSGTRRLIESAVSTYEKSKGFYADAAERAAELPLRTPEEGETTVVLVSDRHDNVGMDKVARAIGDRAGATGVFDAGDDTSTGSTWEAFSLDSVTAAFDDVDRWAVTGNHDQGDFVGDYLAELGWSVLDGDVVDGPGGSTLLGVPDPRSSGLGNWRDETGLSFDEVETRLADEACAAQEDGERVSTLLVHDANLGRESLARGCVDLVVGGHLHEQVGPTRVVGHGGLVGYSYTNGTTGGAAYAIAVGSKPRRPAMVTVLTYRDGRPAGVQAVTLRTTGGYVVQPYQALDLGSGVLEVDTTDPDPEPGLGEDSEQPDRDSGTDPDPDTGSDGDTGTEARPAR
ncbi:metallophosphoesterase family protein [Nocardioides ferulae]|uniref:metallophosphoesterase family protein n=1 Tax=Nocardioides ferulae TaxID=2340821 RepID=UPI0019817054|nr:metallophosphoesterase [Nocardioides ferulae]